MLDFDIENLCYGCEACSNICPTNAITMVEGQDGFLYPKINEEKCIKCKLCDKSCQVLNPIGSKIPLEKRKCFAIYNKNEEVRKESSSGGLFSVLSNKLISDNGIIFGAIFDKNMEVVHSYTDSYDKLHEMRGSKYVQSRIGDTYKVVKEKLKNNNKVLFTGTPCQINGLYKFLGKRHENLYTCDVVCHGVPSPLVFKKYKSYIEKNNNNKIKNYTFRDKSTGWRQYSIKIKFEDNTEKRILFHKDMYMKGFLKDLYLRNSCYKCECKGENILSDITIGDFWGIENKYPEYDENKGVCAVIANTSKGLNILNDVRESIFMEEINIQDILEDNPCVVKAVKYNKKRNSFFKNIDNVDLYKNIERNIKDSILYRFKRKIKNILHKFIKIIRRTDEKE